MAQYPPPHSSATDRFSRLLEACPAGVLVVDEQCQILLVNQQIEDWFQYSRSELIGQPIEILVPDSVRPQHVALRNGYLAAPIVRPIQSGRVLHGRRKDGSEFSCDISLHPVPSAEGLEIMVHVVDTTERRRLEAERQQQQSLRQLRFIVDNLPAGAIYVSQSQLVINRAVEVITGYSQQELSNVEHWFTRLAPRQFEELMTQYQTDRLAGFPEARLVQIFRKDGQTRWIEHAAYRDGDHELWLLHDVTEQQAEQARLVQSERLAAIGQMMTTLAHESRNALQRAQACLEMMQLDLDQNSELMGLANRTQLALDELQRLYEEVRGFASPLSLELQVTLLSDIWQQVWKNLATIRGDKEIAFITTCSPAQLLVKVDRHRMAQVFRNILENSIAVLPTTGGKISIHCEFDSSLTNNGLKLSLQDNGPGLNAEQRSRIFEPFYTTKSRGTGLGMAIARRVMEAHGGTISVGDSAIGTEIILQFPLTLSQSLEDLDSPSPTESSL